MARRKRKGGCKGTKFIMKMKGGIKRCVCGFTKGGRFVTQFMSSDSCPVGTKSMTYKQARTKLG